MEQQRIKQKKFMTFAFGGPNEYSGKDMRKGHAHLDIKEIHFNTIGYLLEETL